ncbi:MAG TPA: amidohydrolase family protein [Chloroflexota bacterium]|nr:amidohydrolase family protein [Chloroflexota bacterium]
MAVPPASPAARGRSEAGLSAIDVDLHHQIVDWSEVAPHVPAGLRWRVSAKSGPPLARHGFQKVGAGTGNVPMPAADSGTISHPAGDPRWVKEHYLDRRGVNLAILTGSLFSLGVQPGPDLASAIARGVNDWTLENWVRPFRCFKGSILIAQQDPIAAVAEIDRLGSDSGMVQVLLGSAAESPLGRRAYHPIYEACVRHGLPLALHLGGEGAGMSPPSTPVGHPSTYFEWYGSLPQSYMGHITSMVTEGVFEKFPKLKVILYEGGVFWLPHLIWRFDKNWKAQRSETPWVTRPPSSYVLDHFYSTTYPLEAPPNPRYLGEILDIIHGERTLLFAGNYPNWELGDPFDMIRDVPDDLRQGILVDNALSVYGKRLLA